MELIYINKGQGTRFPNKYYECEDCIKIKVYNNKDIQFFKVDKEDIDKAKVCNWKLVKSGRTYYAMNSIHGQLHRLIIPCTGKEVDHINGDGKDNRKINLRAVSHLENARNVHFSKKLGLRNIEIDKYSVRVFWKDFDKKQKSKRFSINKLGFEQALCLAKEFRNFIDRTIYKKTNI